METSTVLSIHRDCSFYEYRFLVTENFLLSQFHLDTCSSVTVKVRDKFRVKVRVRSWPYRLGVGPVADV